MKKQKYKSRIKNTAWICASALFLIFANSSNSFADIKGEMDSLANQATSAADTFMQQTVEKRLGYEYRQGFISEAQGQNMRELAQKASDQLDDILQRQLKIKKQIENYNGEDWDSRYGNSGVWRSIGVDICNTKILESQILYYSAQAASGRLEAAQILNKALTELAGLPEEALNIMLVKADIYAMLGKSDENSTRLASELYRKILSAQNVPDEMYYPAAIATQKLNPPQSPQVLNELEVRLERSNSRNNFELYMKLAFIERQLGSTAILEKIVKRWPQSKEFIGNLVLSCLTAQSSPQLSKLTAFEADCAAAAALQNEPAKYQDLFEAMAQIPDFQTVRVLYAAAASNTQKSPAKAIAFFVKASRLHREPNDGFEMPSEIAKKAAAIAIDFAKREPANCELTKRAVENYFSLAAGTIDRQIEYSYSSVLTDCSDSNEAQKLLQKIASSDSKFSQSAKADLANSAISKSQKMLQAGEFREAAKILITADVNVCQCRGHAINLLAQYVEKIDEYADSNSVIGVFDGLGRKIISCPDEQNRAYAAGLYAQAAIFDARGRREKLDTIEKLLNSLDKTSAENLDVRYAQARLSVAQKKHDEAARQWGAICGILKSQPNEPPQHSWHWWQAKYFELENSLKITGASRQDIIHSIDVLQSSFEQIPAFWDKKLKALQSAKN